MGWSRQQAHFWCESNPEDQTWGAGRGEGLPAHRTRRLFLAVRAEMDAAQYERPTGRKNEKAEPAWDR
jgi:hypothetical protein